MDGKWLRLAAVVSAALACGLARGGAHRVLFFSQTQGYRHKVIPYAKTVVAALGRESGKFEVEECADCTKWSADYLGRYDAIVSFGSGELPLSEENKKALLEFVRGGKGFVAIHSAAYMCPKSKWPGYAEMLGAVFVNHPWHQKVRVIVEDRKHPATAHLGETFEIHDEIYQFGSWSRQKTHVLLSLDNSSVDVKNKRVRRKDLDFALAWCHTYGKGRVFYTALGHDRNVWDDPRFRKHVLGGILWALGEADADIPLGFDGRAK